MKTVSDKVKKKQIIGIVRKGRAHYQVITSADLDKLSKVEKIELFQQIEIAQGLRRKDVAQGELLYPKVSPIIRSVLRRYSLIKDDKRKEQYANEIKKQLFESIKASLAQ